MDKPWSRQKGETEKAFEAFSIYRDMGEARTFTAVSEKLQKSYTLIRRWKEKWLWEERVLAYDNTLEDEGMKQAKKEYRAMLARHTNLAMGLQQKAVIALNDLDPKDMTVRDIKDCIKMATDLEVQARGMNLGNEETGKDRKISINILSASQAPPEEDQE